MNVTKLITWGVVALFVIIGGFAAVEITTVPGGHVGVLQTWNGIDPTPQMSKTYTLIPGFTQEMHLYDVTSKTFTFDNYTVQSKDNQDMKIDFKVAYHLDPTKVPTLHQSAGRDYEESVLKNRLFSIVKDEATVQTALVVYSGNGLVNLQSSIEKILMDKNGELAQRGLIVENFVIINIELHAAYTKEITERQVAIQTQLRAVEQTKAAVSLAEKAKADAQADYEKVLVEARRDKEKGVLAAEQQARQEVIAAEAAAMKITLNAKANAEQTVVKAEASAKEVALRAEAEKRQAILVAEGEKEAGLLRAHAIQALGAAEAEAQKLRLSAYAVPGADSFVKIEVAKSFAQGMSNIKGVVPSDMKINVFSENFSKGVSVLADGK